MKTTILRITGILFLLAATFATFAQSPLPSTIQQTRYKYGTAAGLGGVNYQNVEPDGFSGMLCISGTDTAAFMVDSAGNTVIYNSNNSILISGDTLWKDYFASSIHPIDTTLIVTRDSISTTTDALFIYMPIDFLAGSELSQVRVKYRGSDASQGWKLSLWKRADGSASATTSTQIGSTQTLVNNGATVATYNFTDEAMIEGTSYMIQLESEAPSGTATLYSVGVQTIKRGL